MNFHLYKSPLTEKILVFYLYVAYRYYIGEIDFFLVHLLESMYYKNVYYRILIYLCHLFVTLPYKNNSNSEITGVLLFYK